MDSDNLQAVYKQSVLFFYHFIAHPEYSLPTPLCSEPHSPIIDIVHPAPTRHIDARYLESQSVSQSPEMVHPSMHQPLYQFTELPHQVIPRAGNIEYEYEPTQYYEAHLETSPSNYYHGVHPGYYHGGNFSYSVVSPYAHMQLPCPPSSYIQPYPTALYGFPINTPPETRRNSYALYTPMSSNPSSGTTSPQFEHLDTPHEYDSINSAEGTDALPTPVTPTTLPRPRNMGMPANLLLAQSGITSEPITMLSAYHQQDAFAPRAPIMHHHHESSAFHTPAPYQPLSPVSPVLEHSTEAFSDASEIPTAVAPSSTTFVAESGQTDEQVVEEGGGAESPIDAAQSQAAARLKKLRERRHVIACSFCRGRKVCRYHHLSQARELTPSCCRLLVILQSELRKIPRMESQIVLQTLLRTMNTPPNLCRRAHVVLQV